MRTKIVSKFLKFRYRKRCMFRLRFQNIYRLNRRPFFSLLHLKEKCTRYVGVSTKETDLFEGHNHRTGQNKIVYYHTYFQPLALSVEQTQIAKLREMRIPLNLKCVRFSRVTSPARIDASEIGINKNSKATIGF